jgi:serine/threonine-protein kinase
MGAVYEALDESLGRPVALKVIAPALADDAEARRRFIAEARAQAALDSPHVVQVLAHGEVDGVVFIATQLVPDGDLARLLRDHGALPAPVALDVVAQVADGLSEAHRIGLLHHDIKPSNVLLRDRGVGWTAYLADFGLAAPIGAPGDGAGTPAYLAPEVAAGGTAGMAADIYALGCLLWAVLAGRAPAGPLPLELPGRGRFARDVNRILRSATAEDPAARYPRVELLRDDLRALGRARSRSSRPAVIASVVVVLAALVHDGSVSPTVLRDVVSGTFSCVLETPASSG